MRRQLCLEEASAPLLQAGPFRGLWAPLLSPQVGDSVTTSSIGQHFSEIHFPAKQFTLSLVVLISPPNARLVTFKPFGKPAVSDDFGHFSSVFLCLFYF